jgi:hypothetical protein
VEELEKTAEIPMSVRSSDGNEKNVSNSPHIANDEGIRY